METVRKNWAVWHFSKEGEGYQDPKIPKNLSPVFAPGAGKGMAEDYLIEIARKAISSDKVQCSVSVDPITKDVRLFVDYQGWGQHVVITEDTGYVYPQYYHERKQEAQKFADAIVSLGIAPEALNWDGGGSEI